MLFDPDDEDAFFRRKDELVAAFERTKAGRDHGWIADTVLDLAFQQLGRGWSSTSRRCPSSCSSSTRAR